MTSGPHVSMAASERPISERPTNVRWTIFSLACGTSFLLYLHRYTWNFVAVFLETDYGFTKTEIGTLFTFFLPTYGGGQIPSGIICDAIGAHAFLASIMVVGAVILPCYAIANSFSTLAMMRLAFGAAQAGTYPSLSKVTATWFPVKNRTIMQGWIATFFGRSGGAMSSIILGTLLIGVLGLSWQTSLVVMGGLGVLFAALFFALFRNSPDSDPRVNDAERELIHEDSLTTPENAPRVLPWRRVVRSRTLLFFVIQQITSAGADTIYVSFMGLYFVSARGFDISEAGFLVSLPLFGGAIGGILGRLSE